MPDTTPTPDLPEVDLPQVDLLEVDLPEVGPFSPDPSGPDRSDTLTRLRDAEDGAQAMEYAMLGGAGVASVSVITWILSQQWFRDAVEDFVTGLFGSLGERVLDLLPSIGGLF